MNAEKLIVFHAGGVRFGVRLLDVAEVVDVEDLEPLEGSFPYRAARLRDDVVFWVDLGAKFGLGALSGCSRLILFQLPVPFGLAVPAPLDVAQVGDDDLKPVPRLISTSAAGRYVASFAVVRDEVVLVLEPTALLSPDELAELIQARQKLLTQVRAKVAKV